MQFPPVVSGLAHAGPGAEVSQALPDLPARQHPRPKFPKDVAGFHATLRQRVEGYFAPGRSDRDHWRMYLKTAIILAWLAGSYALLVFVVNTLWLAIPLAIIFAAAVAAVGFNIQHDGSHHAYSRHEWINRLAAISLDLIGASSFLWKWKHNVLHHTYPNVSGQDTDIEAGAVARLAPHQPRRWFHRWQHLYLWPLYAITASRWHLWGDFKEVITGRMTSHPIPRPRGWDLFVFLFGKVFSIGLMLVVPMLFHPWWVVLLFYMLVTGAVGVILTVVFQLAHCVREADFPIPSAATQQMPDAWAVHQVVTTVNFSRRSRLVCWFLGGLNFQIEHHLFPRVCHVHYPALSQIVEQVCREYGVRYSVHESLLGGLKSHYWWLHKMGHEESGSGTR